MPFKMIEHFAANPYLTIKNIAKKMEVAYSTAHNGLQKLLKATIIVQVKEQKRNRSYCAQQILDILEEPTKIRAADLVDHLITK